MSRSSVVAAIDVPPSRVWAVLVDVESWPRWTASMTAVQRLDSGPLQVGSTARVEQPRMRPLTWTVTELVPESTFTWATAATGMHIAGTHTITEIDTGRTQLDLAITSTGPLAAIVDLAVGRRTRRYLQLEAAGVKAAAEA